MKQTLRWYNENAVEYSAETAPFDVEEIYSKVLDGMGKNLNILDFGCGAGRDTAYFNSKGHNVVALDQSRKLVEETYKRVAAKTGKAIGLKTVVANYVDWFFFNYNDDFDIIWCNQSLYHLPTKALSEVVAKLYQDYLKKGGKLFMNFKNGMLEKRAEDGRFYNNVNQKKMNNSILTFPYTSKEEWSAFDSNGQRWYNIILTK